MTKTAHREDGAEQPSIKCGMFRIRLPFIHAPWEFPEMIQAIVVFVTGVSAMAYLQDIFGLSFGTALAIVTVHEFLYIFQNIVGDPIVGGMDHPGAAPGDHLATNLRRHHGADPGADHAPIDFGYFVFGAGQSRALRPGWSIRSRCP